MSSDPPFRGLSAGGVSPGLHRRPRRPTSADKAAHRHPSLSEASAMHVPTFLSESTRSPTTAITATEMPAMAPEERVGSLPPAVPFHEVAEDGASAGRWSRAAQAAADARDASIIGFTRCARAAREVVSTGPRHRLTALCHKWDCREALSSHEQHHAVWK